MTDRLKHKLIIAVIVFAGSIATASLLWLTGPTLSPETPEVSVPTVVTTVAIPERIQMIVHAQGTVSPRTATDLVPEISGSTVWVSPNLVPGGYFNRDEILLRIDDRDYRDAVERASATVDRTEAEEEHARFELNRLKQLNAPNFTSDSDVAAAIRLARVAEANLVDAKVALKQAERDLARTKILAPFAGLVANKSVDVGQFVGRGTTVARLYAANEIEVRLPIADRQLAYLDLPPLQRGEIDESSAPAVLLSAHFAGRDYSWQAKLVRTEAEIDLSSRMIYAVARLDSQSADAESPDSLPPPIGLFVQAEIHGRVIDDIVVLPRTVLRDTNQVLVVKEGRLRFRTVSVTRIYRDHVYVNGGLSQGELVCTTALQSVIDGMRVKTHLNNPVGNMETEGL